MERTRFVGHRGRNILLMDFSNVTRVDEGIRIIEEAKQFVARQPKIKHLLTLVDVSESTFDDRIIAKLKELAKHDEPWVLAGAVVGMHGLQKIMFRIITTFSGRKLAAFDSVDEAKDWLVSQKEPPQVVPEVRL